jgi:hypothetical protein
MAKNVKNSKADIISSVFDIKTKIEETKKYLSEFEQKEANLTKVNLKNVITQFPEITSVLSEEWLNNSIKNNLQYTRNRIAYNKSKIEKLSRQLEKYTADLEELTEIDAKYPEANVKFGKIFTMERPKDKPCYASIKVDTHGYGRYASKRYFFLMYTKNGKKHEYFNINETQFVNVSHNYKTNKQIINMSDYSSAVPDYISNKKQILKRYERLIYRDFLMKGYEIAKSSHNYDVFRGFLDLE